MRTVSKNLWEWKNNTSVLDFSGKKEWVNLFPFCFVILKVKNDKIISIVENIY